MQQTAPVRLAASAKLASAPWQRVQRWCACGAAASSLRAGECTHCGHKRVFDPETRPAIGDAGERYEQEAERIAESVTGLPMQQPVGVAAPRSQAARAESAREAYRVPPFQFARVRVHAAEAARLEIDPLAPETVPPRSDGIAPLADGGGSGEEGEEKAPDRPGPKCGEELNWIPQSPVPVDVTADSVVDFAAKIDQALGGTPHTAAEPSWDLEASKGKVDKTNATLKTTIIRPRYAGGRASDKEKALIRRVVKFIKEHEERHRDIARAAYQQAICDALGKSLTAADKVFEKTRCDTEPDAQAALDGKEGKIEWVKDVDGNVVDFKAVGVKANYRPDDCEKK